jgi:23S rRNA (guanine745-N1)-methyltransferase
MSIICPLCRHPLQPIDKSWRCSNQHSFDIARQGYTNLLPVQHKKSRAPGDDAAMVNARRQFLDGGYYQPLSAQINQVALEYLQQNAIAKPLLIDAGCGEGYYSSRLKSACNAQQFNIDLTGIDISKPAIHAAAKRDASMRWFVASSSAIPIADHSADMLLCLFAPLQAAEFYRCLKPQSLLVVASTGKNHLLELREQLYTQVHDRVFDPATAVGQYFSWCQTYNVNFNIHLPDTLTIKNLLAMTPHYWRVSPQRKGVLDTLDNLSVTVDIQLHTFQPRLSAC